MKESESAERERLMADGFRRAIWDLNSEKAKYATARDCAIGMLEQSCIFTDLKAELESNKKTLLRMDRPQRDDWWARGYVRCLYLVYNGHNPEVL